VVLSTVRCKCTHQLLEQMLVLEMYLALVVDVSLEL